MRPVALTALVALALLAPGCASPEPTLYTLAMVPRATVPAMRVGRAPARILVREVTVAKYLDRDHVVRSSEGYRVSVEGNEWWGEPLPAMIGRVLADDLAQRLPGTQVLTAGSAISTGADARVEVDVRRLDADRSGVVVLDAQVAVTRPDSSRSVHLMVRPAGVDVRSEIAAMSEALGQLADVAAEMLRS